MQLSEPEYKTELHAGILMLFILTSFFFCLGSTPLFDVDEGAFSEATREMILNKNYLTTYLNNAPRFDKPILFYWLQALSVKLLGQHEFAFRLPSALAGSVWAASIFFFLRREADRHQAFFATAFMVLSLQVMVIAKAAIADALLNCLLAITMFSLFRHYSTGSKPALLLAFAVSGLGMLTKGPIALLIPLAVTFLFSLQEGSLKSWLKMLLDPLGILLFLGIALPWYVLEYRDQGMAFIEGFFFKHNISRFNTSLEKHSGSILYYIPVLIIGMMPFTGLVFTVILNMKKLLTDRLNRFLLIWFVFVFLFFSMSGTKLPHYVIYGYTPLFILMARALPHSRHPAGFVIWPLVFLALFAGIVFFARPLVQQTNNGYIADLFEAGRQLFGQFHMLIMVSAAIAICVIQLIPGISSAARLVAFGVICSLVVNFHLFPLAGRLLQEPVKEAALLAKKEGYKTVMWNVYYPSFLVYSESFTEKKDPEPGEIAITTADELRSSGKPAAILYSKNGIVLVKMNR